LAVSAPQRVFGAGAFPEAVVGASPARFAFEKSSGMITPAPITRSLECWIGEEKVAVSLIGI
jgi:hypothetical protein